MINGSEPTERTGSVWLVGGDDTSAGNIEQVLAANGGGLALKRVTHDDLRRPYLAGCADAALIVLDLDSLRENDTGRAGARAVREVAAKAPCPAIVISSSGSLPLVVEAIKSGADDFLPKPLPPSRLRECVSSAIANRQTGASSPPSAPPSGQSGFHGFIGSSPAMQRVYETIGNIAGSSASVFIRGESGTGKELCVAALHRLSRRADRPLVSINCSAIPRDLMASEIFGHADGAPSGTTSVPAGAALQADGGTLFLDEICEMDMALQARLLRFIESGVVHNAGGTAGRKVDVRFVCATNRDPMAAIESGRFRADLFYRLNVLPAVLPPLRERGDDAVMIAEALIGEIAREESSAFRDFSDKARHLIRNYSWPGNVRELLNVLRNVVVMNRGETVSGDMLAMALAHGGRDLSALARQEAPANITAFPERVGADAAPDDGVEPLHGRNSNGSRLRPLWQQERDIIEGAIEACGGNIARAAAELEINPSTIYRKRQSWAAGVA